MRRRAVEGLTVRDHDDSLLKVHRVVACCRVPISALHRLLQYVAVCCRVLQCVVVCYRVLHCVAVPYCVMDIYQRDAQVFCYDSSVESA